MCVLSELIQSVCIGTQWRAYVNVREKRLQERREGRLGEATQTEEKRDKHTGVGQNGQPLGAVGALKYRLPNLVCMYTQC